MAKRNTRLELTWIGKENRSNLEPRILIEDSALSYHAKYRVSREKNAPINYRQHIGNTWTIYRQCSRTIAKTLRAQGNSHPLKASYQLQTQPPATLTCPKRLCYISSYSTRHNGAISMTTSTELQYISDEEGNLTGVLIPIDLWHDIASEMETAHLLKSEKMKRRLLEAKQRCEGIPLEEALQKLKICK